MTRFGLAEAETRGIRKDLAKCTDPRKAREIVYALIAQYQAHLEMIKTSMHVFFDDEIYCQIMEMKFCDALLSEAISRTFEVVEQQGVKVTWAEWDEYLGVKNRYLKGEAKNA